MNIVAFIKKNKLSFVLIGVVLYQLLCAIQGFDLSDEGWAMYFYQQIFVHPETVTAQMPYWFTGIIGGLLNMIYPEGGYFFMRILGIIMVTLTFYLSYNFLKKYLNTSLLLLGLSAQILIVAGDPKPFGYNSLTSFLIIIVIYLFFYGMEKKRSINLFLGGILLGLTIFARIPNLVMLVLLLLIPAYTYLKEQRIFIFSKPFLWSVAGCIFGIAASIITMKQLGHWDLFLESMQGTIASASEKSNSHQLGSMLIQYFNNYVGILYVGASCIIVGLIYIFLKKFVIKSDLLLIPIAIIIGYYSIYYNLDLRNNDMYFVHFISYFGITMILINHNKLSYGLKFATFASFLMIVFMPLGSDFGIVTFWQSSWIALPLSTAYLYGLLKERQVTFRNKTIIIDRNVQIRYFYTLFLVFFLTGIYKVDCMAYYDPGCRFEKTYPINNKFSRHIYTNENRSKLINEMLPALSEYVKPGDYLLAYDFLPGINYMTETLSFTPNSWLYAYTGSDLTRELNKSLKEKKKLPVILRQHFIATNKWRDYSPDFYDKNFYAASYYGRGRPEAINKFLSENNYQPVWSNKFFEILLPGKTKQENKSSIE